MVLALRKTVMGGEEGRWELFQPEDAWGLSKEQLLLTCSQVCSEEECNSAWPTLKISQEKSEISTCF